MCVRAYKEREIDETAQPPPVNSFHRPSARKSAAIIIMASMPCSESPQTSNRRLVLDPITTEKHANAISRRLQSRKNCLVVLVLKSGRN